MACSSIVTDLFSNCSVFIVLGLKVSAGSTLSGGNGASVSGLFEEGGFSLSVTGGVFFDSPKSSSDLAPPHDASVNISKNVVYYTHLTLPTKRIV